jgi:hypothetical protein
MIDYPDPGRAGKQSCCFFRSLAEKVLFCCTKTTGQQDQSEGACFTSNPCGHFRAV